MNVAFALPKTVFIVVSSSENVLFSFLHPMSATIAAKGTVYHWANSRPVGQKTNLHFEVLVQELPSALP